MHLRSGLLSGPCDPRYYQVAVLSSLLVFGIGSLGFGISWLNAAAILGTALGLQFGATAMLRLPRFDPLSALITALSLTLLLRTDDMLLAAAAAAVAIGSKFVVRVGGKHVFNPANIGLVAVTSLSGSAWISPGQWGSAAVGALLLCGLGLLVLTRARRAETTLGFLACFGLLLTGRALWLGDPLEIAAHQLQSGALLVFAFFMISDPKTTPNSAPGRLLFAAIVAGVAFVIRFVYFVPGAPILALAICAPLVPLIDLLSRGQLYSWTSAGRPVSEQPRGVN